MIRIAALVAALAAVAAAPSVAVAQNSSSGAVPQVSVRYQDLNLNTDDGARKLARRIDAAADYVCGGQPTSAAEEGANADYGACRKEAVAAALRQVGSSRLAAVVEGRRLIRLATR